MSLLLLLPLAPQRHGPPLPLGGRAWSRASGPAHRSGFPRSLFPPHLLSSVSSDLCPSPFSNQRVNPHLLVALPGLHPLHLAGHPFPVSTLLVQASRAPGPICTTRALDHHLAAGIREQLTRTGAMTRGTRDKPGWTGLLRREATAQWGQTRVHCRDPSVGDSVWLPVVLGRAGR